MSRVPALATILAISLVSFTSLGVGQQPAQHSAPQNTAAAKNEALIDQLVSYPFGEVYTDDITLTNSITYFGKKIDDNGVIPAPPVKAIADLEKTAIPLLISHLSDQRPTQAEYRKQPVPLAYLALDLLLHFTDTNDERTVIPNCERQGLSDCMQPDFYFSPDASDRNVFVGVQKDWVEENKRQPINFVYPTWWRSAETATRPMPEGSPPKSNPRPQ